MSTYKYKGTKIKHTTSTAKVCENSGVKNAAVGQLYLNTKYGHYYKCTTAGGPKVAKWKYQGTLIRKKPAEKVSSVSKPARESGGSHKLTTTWKVPSSATKSTKQSRATGIRVIWTARINTDGKEETKTYYRKDVSISTKKSTFDLDSVYSSKRGGFHPSTSKRYLESITMSVAYVNAKGAGEAVTKTLGFGIPRAPSIAALTQNESTGVVSTTITTDAGQDAQERYDTYYEVGVLNTRVSNKESLTTHTSSTATSIAASYDAADRMLLTYAQYIKVTVRAMARGYRGNSKTVSRTYYVSYPAQPTITGYRIDKINGSTNVTDATNKLTLTIRANSSTEHPVTGVRLQTLANVRYKTASAIPADADWTDTNIVDNASCTALSTTVAELIPERGNYTWVRVKSWNTIEDTFYRYSAPKNLTDLHLETATATDDTVTIVSAEPGEDGESVVVQLGWDDDDSTGNILAWSTDINAWRSNVEPTSLQMPDSEWLDTTLTSDYDNNAVAYIMGLDSQTHYYFKARRYLESDDDTSYGDWSAVLGAKTATAPASVTLTAPEFVERGMGVNLAWTYEGGATQTEWQLVTGEVTTDTTTTPYTTSWTSDERTVVARGTDSLGGATIDGARLQSLAGDDDELPLAIRVSTGGELVESDIALIEIADAPTVECATADVTDAQPLSIALAGSSATSTATVVVAALGASGEWPDGMREQPEGDAIWSAALTPTWASATYGTTLCYVQALEAAREVEAAARLDAYVDVTTAHTYDTTELVVVDGAIAIVPIESGEEDYTPLTLAWTWSYADGRTGATGYSAEPYRADSTGTADTSGAYWAAVVHDDAYTYYSDLTTYALTATITVTSATDYADADAGTSYEAALAARTALEATATDTIYAATVYAPSGLDFWDGAKYCVTVTATDPRTQLTSDAATCTTTTAWARQAPEPPEPTLTPYDTTDEETEYRTRGCTIELATSDTLAATDVYDVYRVTPDGPYLVAQGVAAGVTVTDSYAPFSDDGTEYRLAVRTVDGDVDWEDFDYELDGTDVRIDFGNDYVELPYNITLSDGYSKDFEQRKHLDGSIAGYWQRGRTRKLSISAAIVAAEQADIDAQLRALASYDGPCLVRLPDGCCFDADVQVTGLGKQAASSVESISITASEINLTAAHMATLPTEEEDE